MTKIGSAETFTEPSDSYPVTGNGLIPHEEPKQDRQRVLIIDDHPIMRIGLCQLINREPDLEICGEVDDSQEAIEVVTTLQPAIVLVGLAVHGRDGLDLLKMLRDQAPRVPFLVLSDYDETLYAVRTLQAGARGYHPKRVDAEVLIEAIRQVLRGDIAVSDRLRSQLIKTAILGRPVGTEAVVSRLSDRELEVLRYIGQGYSTREIASLLCLSVKTVETHRSHLIKKLHLQNARNLIRYAVHWLAHLEAD